MRFIKTYKLFLEEADFEIRDSDSQDVKLSKDKLNDLKKYLTEYNQKKSQLDKVFLTSKDPKVLDSEVKKIIGGDSEKRNPFLVEYTTVSRLKRDVENFQNENAKDKVKLDDFNQELGLSKETDTKASVSAKIQDIKMRMSTRLKNLEEINKEISKKEKELLDKMKKIETEMKLNITKISSLDKK